MKKGALAPFFIHNSFVLLLVKGVTVIRWRNQGFLDGPWADPTEQVQQRTRLVVGA